MKVLSVRQPYASLIAAGVKRFESRTWSTDYRGPLLIHASSSKIGKSYIEAVESDRVFVDILRRLGWATTGALQSLPRSALIAVVQLEDVCDGIELDEADELTPEDHSLCGRIDETTRLWRSLFDCAGYAKHGPRIRTFGDVLRCATE